MTQLTSLFARTLVAAALFGSAAFASADVLYHVDIKTASLTSSGAGTGFLDLYFSGFGAADPVGASLSNLTGDFIGAATVTDVGAGKGGTLYFDSSLSSDYFQQFTFGQDISFDLLFSGTQSDLSGAGFHADILNADQSDYLSNAVSFELLGASAPTFTTDAGIATVQATATNDVPEPSMLLSLFTGLGLMGLTLRRRMR